MRWCETIVCMHETPLSLNAWTGEQTAARPVGFTLHVGAVRPLATQHAYGACMWCLPLDSTALRDRCGV